MATHISSEQKSPGQLPLTLTLVHEREPPLKPLSQRKSQE